MKSLRIGDEDFTLLAGILAREYPELFARIFIPATSEKRRTKDNVTTLQGADYEYFMEAWKAWPDAVPTKKWIAGYGFEKKTVLKGSRQIAMNNFIAMLRKATARELYAAAIVYLNEAPSVKEGFVQNVATFYGPKKGTVLEWLDRAKEMIEEQDGRDGA